MRNEDIVSHYSILSPDDALLHMVAEALSIRKWIRWSLVVMLTWNKLVEANIVGFLHSKSKQLQRRHKCLQTFKSKTTLEC
jgi:hypothetical protein